MGIRPSLASAQPVVLALVIWGLKPFPTHFGGGLVLPLTSSALWCWLRGHDRGDLLHQSKKIADTVAATLKFSDGVIDAFSYSTAPISPANQRQKSRKTAARGDAGGRKPPL